MKSLPRERLSRALSRVVSLARALSGVLSLSRVVSLHLRLLLLQGSVSICTFVRVKRVPGAASVAGGLRQCLCFCTSTTSKIELYCFTALLLYCFNARCFTALLVYCTCCCVWRRSLRAESSWLSNPRCASLSTTSASRLVSICTFRRTNKTTSKTSELTT